MKTGYVVGDDVMSFQINTNIVTEKESFDLVKKLKPDVRKSIIVLEIPYATDISVEAMVIIRSFLAEFHRLKTKCVILASPAVIEKFNGTNMSSFVQLIAHKSLKEDIQNVQKSSVDGSLSHAMVEGVIQSIDNLTSFSVVQAHVLDNSQVTYMKSAVGSCIGFSYRQSDSAPVKMGEIILQIPENTHLELVRKITGIDYQDINDENRDWVCEIMNMSSVLAREYLTRKDKHIYLTLPTLLSADSLKHKLNQKAESYTSSALVVNGLPMFLVIRNFN